MCTDRGHVSMLGDLVAVGKALEAVVRGRRKGIGMGWVDGDGEEVVVEAGERALEKVEARKKMEAEIEAVKAAGRAEMEAVARAEAAAGASREENGSGTGASLQRTDHVTAVEQGSG